MAHLHSTQPNTYDDQQNKHLGDPADGYKLLQGSGTFAPVVGDSLYYSNQGANPRWLNLTKLLGALNWAVGTGTFYRYAITSAWADMRPQGSIGPCILNPDVSWQMTQTPNLGSLQSIDAFAWACSINCYVNWDLVATGANTPVTGHIITTKIYKNGVESGLVAVTTTNATTAGNTTTISGWLSVNPNDILDVRMYNNTVPNGTDARVYIFSLDVVAQRLKT